MVENVEKVDDKNSVVDDKISVVDDKISVVDDNKSKSSIDEINPKKVSPPNQTFKYLIY